mmetsp:Transcript_852/g.2704  ORF Transcript_852/g.2704 Transcript_852/m.2704 type:complete len:138 (-) Transcript_852:380-793(-)
MCTGYERWLSFLSEAEKVQPAERTDSCSTTHTQTSEHSILAAHNLVFGWSAHAPTSAFPLSTRRLPNPKTNTREQMRTLSRQLSCLLLFPVALFNPPLCFNTTHPNIRHWNFRPLAPFLVSLLTRKQLSKTHSERTH